MERNERRVDKRGSIIMNKAESSVHDVFTKYDKGAKGYVTRMECKSVLEELFSYEFELEHVEILYKEFDNNKDQSIDYQEFKVMHGYLKELQPAKKERRKSIDINNLFSLNPFNSVSAGFPYDTYDDKALSTAELAMGTIVKKAIKKSRRDSTIMLKAIAKSVYPLRDVLCIQDYPEDDEENERAGAMNMSVQIDFDDLFDDDSDDDEEFGNPMDPDFVSAFPASEMRCLALVSHNGMKKTMREFVIANKNLLKKFRLTGTNSTMTMLREVFADEPAGTVIFGPSCASGPLGGDAELVAHMVNGKIGGIYFFQDPMDSHPHRADIDCLVRQVLVHNVMIAETPTSALMINNCLRHALAGKGKPELIPSFFFSLQSPTVEAYKRNQKSVVDAQKALIKKG